MARKEFKAPVSRDFRIIRQGVLFGTVRVKPSGLLWRRKGARKWRRVRIREFAEYAEKHGSERDK